MQNISAKKPDILLLIVHKKVRTERAVELKWVHVFGAKPGFAVLNRFFALFPLWMK